MLNSEKYISKAFTLAEVLIVLAVIGVVAAMTMPMLTSNYQKTQQVTALRKVYSQLSEAVERNMNDENVENFTETSLLYGSNPDPKAFFKKYFKVSKYCEAGQSASCFPSKTSSIDKSIQNKNIIDLEDDTHCAILKDGTSICVLVQPGDNYWWRIFYIDTNGINKPNIYGRDIWYIYAYYDGSVDDFNPKAIYENGNGARNSSRTWRCESYGETCLSRIIEDGWKMDY